MAKMNMLRLASVSLSSLLVLSACSENSKTAAGGTEAESTIALQVRLADGTAAANARVRALPEGYLADGLQSAEWTVADESGFVEFKDMEPGAYMVEARNSDEAKNVAGAVFSVVLDSTVARAVDTLQLDSLTRIEGYVTPGQGPSVIRIPGLERFVIPDSSGHFVVDNLPAGNFDLVIESRSNRGTVKLSAAAGETVPEVNLGKPRGFAVEDFERFSGISATGEILGDGWWYTLDAEGKNIMPLWDETLTHAYSGSEGCASGGCARTTNRLGFLLGGFETEYALPSLENLMFSARGSGTLRVSLAYGSTDDAAENGFEYEVKLSKVWEGYSIDISKMKPYGKASLKDVKVSRIDFRVGKGDTLFLDDVFLGGIDEESLISVAADEKKQATEYPKDWKDHDALLKELVGYGVGTRGGAGHLDETEITGEICVVTTTDDYIIVEDTSNVDSLGNAATTAIIAPGSLRDCAYRDTASWIIFEKSGVYNLSTPLRMKSNKTIDGRGRDIRITGMGVLTDVSENLIFENLTFTAPAIATKDTSSRRALSIHNGTHHVWIDHCTFEEYPLVELDVKRGSHSVTVSWSRFENAQTGILFGLPPESFKESEQTMTMHHNYFANMDWSAAFARAGTLHAYNNFFMDLAHYGVECTDSVRCYIERNVFNIDNTVSLYRLWDDKGVAVDSTVGFVKMVDNWIAVASDPILGDANGYKPDYSYEAESADAGLAWKVKNQAGPR